MSRVQGSGFRVQAVRPGQGRRVEVAARLHGMLVPIPLQESRASAHEADRMPPPRQRRPALLGGGHLARLIRRKTGVQETALAFCCLFPLMLWLETAWADATPASPAAMQRDVDEAAFREGLRQRGLDDWLDQHLADLPPVSPVDEQLRLRDKLLAEAGARDTSRRLRQQKVVEAGKILSQLLANHPDHPGRLAWRLELARDKLEREDPAAFEAVLLYELSGRDRAKVARLSGEAIAVLQTLREEVAGAWQAFEALDERSMARAAESGATRALEYIDGQSVFLLTWANFYQAISADLTPAQRNERLTELLATITERHGWTAPSPGREVQRCGALAMSAVALRLTGRFVEADRAAREIAEAVASIRNPGIREGMRRIVLLAVLEQVRGPRDAGKLDDARAILAEARAWADRTQPDDLQTQLALALAERSLLARLAKAGAATKAPAVAGDLLASPEALLPLQRVAASSPAARDMVYEALAGAMDRAALGGELPPFALQLVAGACIADAVTATESAGTQPAGGSRETGIAVALNAALVRAPAPLSAETRGELLFLLARAHYLSGAPLETVRVLCDLVEQHPRHDRAEQAARQATAVAQEAMRASKGPDLTASRAAFVRAVRVLRQHQPQSREARELQFFLAAALDESGQYEEAAEEYAAVAADDPHALRAAWAQARCLRDALNASITSRPADEAAGELIGRALTAARSAAKLAVKATAGDACLAADITLILAGLLNHPSVSQHEEAVTALDRFEERYAGCPAAIAPALRERVSALRQLKRMGEARAAMEQYLAADPQNAGPLMARLLDAMRDEIQRAADRGDTQAMQSTADEAAKLAERLLAWARSHPERMSPAETLTVMVWRAWALLEAGQASEALRLYDQAAQRLAELKNVPDAPVGGLQTEVRLGKAECLLAANKPAEALPAFNEMLSQVPEHSPNWWRAYVGTLECHTRLKSDPDQIRRSIQQQRRLFPDLGGPRWKRELERMEKVNH